MRRLDRLVPRRRRAMTAAAVTALFAASGCSLDAGTARQGSASTTTAPPNLDPSCITYSDGTSVCAVPGRPLRRRRRRRGLLLPADDGYRDDEARIEYASVASFGELALQLIALGAPADLVARCHRAALDEISHAQALDRLAGRESLRFGAVPHLLGRRVGGRSRSRRRQLARIAVESYCDGWLNEGASASDMAARAQRAQGTDEGRALERIAADERGHAVLGRDIVLWCFEESPQSVGRALSRASSSRAAAI